MTFLWSSSTFIKTKLTNKIYLYMCNMDEKKERETYRYHSALTKGEHTLSVTKFSKGAFRP